MTTNTQLKTTTTVKSTPGLGIGGTPSLWFILFAIMAAVGIYAAGTILVQGHSALASTNAVPWNIFVSAYLFFVVIASGICIVSSLGHLLGLEQFETIAWRAITHTTDSGRRERLRPEVIGLRAVTLSIIILLVGMAGILLDIGRPLMMINMLLSPNLTSPMFWMGAAYSIYVLFLILEFFAIRRGDHKAVLRWATLSLITAFFALGTLGALFGMLYSKPMWFGAFTPIYMVATAIVSGLAVLSLFIIMSYQATGSKMPSSVAHVVSELGKVQIFALLGLIFMVFWRIISYFYGSNPDQLMMISGDYAFSFWTFEVIAGLVIPLVILANKSTRTQTGIIVASALIVIGMFAARTNFVIGGQLIRPFEQPMAIYTPTTLENMYVIGLFGFAGVLYMLANKYLNFEKYEQGYNHEK